MNAPVMLITGTSKGIGKYLAQYYLFKGYRVFGCSRTHSDIQDTYYHHFISDVSDEKQILEIFKYLRKEVKRLDVLINNAAINPAIVSAALLPYSTMEQVFKINLFAPMMFCREAIKLMIRNKSGRIINMGSMASKHEVAGEALYTASKTALNAYSRVVAKEVYRQGITVNVVAPSAIPTELSGKINQQALNEVLSRNAIQTFGSMEDVSSAVNFLISKDSNAVTGQLIYLGGV